MRRREFITLAGGMAMAWPLAAPAQRSPMPLIGFLGFSSPQAFATELAAFHRGLGEAGFVEGRNVAIEYRWAQGQFNRLPTLAVELVSWPLSVFAAIGTPAAAFAAKAATKTIPIVFVSGGDPVQMGIVDSLNRPGGNTTGVYMLTAALEPKRIELIRELVPSAAVIGVIVDPNSPDTKLQMEELPAAASALDRQIKIFNASTDSEIDAAFAAVAEQKIGAVLVTSSPADLPIQQSVKVELVVNMKTAKTLGLTFPLTLLGRADEVIE